MGKRQTFVWRNEEWVKLDEGLKGIKAGNLFYLRESTGEIVTNNEGYQVFVATDDSFLGTYENDERYHINCVPVAKNVPIEEKL